LEPYISAEIMVLHHSKHHQAYVNGLNAAEEAYVKAPSTRERIALQAALKFNGGGEYGSSPSNTPRRAPPSFACSPADRIDLPHIYKGHINHSLFWRNLAPAKQGGGELKDGKLKAALERDFGSVDAFKKQFNAATAGIQGSGWGWLGYNTKTEKLEIVTTPNQDPLLSACQPPPPPSSPFLSLLLFLSFLPSPTELSKPTSL